MGWWNPFLGIDSLASINVKKYGLCKNSNETLILRIIEVRVTLLFPKSTLLVIFVFFMRTNHHEQESTMNSENI
jgi:hypothetical protein